MWSTPFVDEVKFHQSKTTELGNNDSNTIVIQADYCNHLDNVGIETLNKHLYENLIEKLVSDQKDMSLVFMHQYTLVQFGNVSISSPIYQRVI